MHELGIVQSFVDTADRYAKDAQAKEVKFVVFEIGEMTGVVPKYVKDYYEDISKGTLLEGSELRIEEVEALGFCRECGTSYHIIDGANPCPSCGEENFEVIQGDKLLIKELGIV